MAVFDINLADIRAAIPEMRAGDSVLLTGTVYTSRDAAHKRIFSILDEGGELPYDLKDACIYFAGPTPSPEGRVIGSCGPTTSGRMDVYSPRLLDLGLAAMIGKGERNEQVRQAIMRNKAVYFCAIGGAGALCAKGITACEEIAFKDLGCESVKKLTLDKYPAYVGIDCLGNTIYNKEK